MASGASRRAGDIVYASQVALRPRVAAKLRLNPERLDALIEAVELRSTVLTNVTETFTYPRDFDDAYYVNLAVEAGAAVIVSRDRDLLDLMDLNMAAGREFRARFPLLRIQDPVQFLREFDEAEESARPNSRSES